MVASQGWEQRTSREMSQPSARSIRDRMIWYDGNIGYKNGNGLQILNF
jgi:hypothetical protein